MAFTLEQLRASLPPLSETAETTWWLGFSGGLDSSVLLHALWQLQLPVRLRAVHVNHQISPYADTWQTQCAAICNTYGVPFEAHRVQIENQGKGIEDAARQARYDVFTHLLRDGDYLFTAHHADDQAETLLLRLMRGAGPRGLAAMAKSRSLGNGYLYRPLLSFPRADLESYAQEHRLRWVSDESNEDDHYDRNFLRNQVMPLLQGRWPGFTRKWQQTAELCAANEHLLEEVAFTDIKQSDERAERLGRSISLVQFNLLSTARQQNLLRYWLKQQGYSIPEQQHWQQIYQQLASARTDAQIDIRWAQVSLRVYRNRLYSLSQQSFDSHLSIEPAVSSPGVVRIRAILSELQIRYRQGGERCKPAGRQHSQTLKKLLQDIGLEPWLRDQVPLVYSGDQLVAVGDLWVCEGYIAEQGEEGFVLHWSFIPAAKSEQ